MKPATVKPIIDQLIDAVTEFHNILDKTGKYPERCEELRRLISRASGETK